MVPLDDLSASYTGTMQEGIRSRQSKPVQEEKESGALSTEVRGPDSSSGSERSQSSRRVTVKLWVFIMTALAMSMILVYSLYLAFSDRSCELSSPGTGVLRFWPIFLTHWTLALEVTFLWVNVMTATSSPSRLARILYAVAMPGSFMVVCLYWLFVYRRDQPVVVINVLAHGGNFLGMLVVLASNHYSYTSMKCAYPMAYGSLWVAWSIIFYNGGFTNQHGNKFIYAIIDWGKPGTTALIISIAIFVFVPIINAATSLLQKSIS